MFLIIYITEKVILKNYQRFKNSDFNIFSPSNYLLQNTEQFNIPDGSFMIKIYVNRF